jgi:hypothetical protein
MDTLLHPAPLELRDRAEDAGHEAAGGRAGVDSVTESHESHAAGLPFVQQQHEVPQVAAEPIEAPAHDGAHLVPLHRRREFVERRAAVFRAADALINELHGAPATGVGVASEFEELILGGLVVGADSA